MVEKYDPSKYLEDEDGTLPPRRALPSDIKLEIVQDAVELLATVGKPLAVLSICGPFRSGKSYFLSRILGDEFFKIGHTMRACTIGLWVSTALLECEEYALLLVDTQGIDSISSAESVGTKLMSVTALLSSYLIYNSKRVPHKVDVEKLRICCLLSLAILCRVTKKEISHVEQRFYPHFLWLLRDVHLHLTDHTGKPLEPTEYMRSRVLKLNSKKENEEKERDAGLLISDFFRSLECRILPLPSSRPDVLKDMLRQKEKLSEKFSLKLSCVLDHILQNACHKKSMDGTSFVNGATFVELVSTFVEAINSDSLPDFKEGWMAQVRARCSEIAEELIAEYKERMSLYLRDNQLPIEEENIMEKHKLLLQQKTRQLETGLCELDPLSLTVDHKDIIKTLEHNLAQYDDDQNISGGLLYHILLENYSVSQTECERLWRSLVTDYAIHEKFSESFSAGVPIDITADVDTLEKDFLVRAVGPAKQDILKRNRAVIIQMSTQLDKLPGEPRNLQVVGVAYNKVKLSWLPPLINPQVVSAYWVNMRMDGGEWIVAKKTTKTKALVTDLLDSAKYEFSVVAISSELMHGLEISKATKTKISREKEFAVNLASGAFPVIAAVNHFVQEKNRGREVSKVKAAAAVALTTMVTPVTLLGFPFSGPLLAMSLANDDQLEQHSRSWGDLSPEEDDD